MTNSNQLKIEISNLLNQCAENNSVEIIKSKLDDFQKENNNDIYFISRADLCHIFRFCDMQKLSTILYLFREKRMSIHPFLYLLALSDSYQYIVSVKTNFIGRRRVEMSLIEKIKIILEYYSNLFTHKDYIFWPMSILRDIFIRRLLLFNGEKYTSHHLHDTYHTYYYYLIRHYYLTNKFKLTAQRYYCKHCAYLLFSQLPVDIIWLIIKYLSR